MTTTTIADILKPDGSLVKLMTETTKAGYFAVNIKDASGRHEAPLTRYEARVLIFELENYIYGVGE